VFMSLTVGPSLASAQEGGSNGGGGADMESEFKAIALNVRDWINGGGSASLELPRGVTNEQYKTGMLRELGSYSIQMVSRELKFGGSVKTCVSRSVAEKDRAKLKVRGQILCNQTLFLNTYKYNTEGAYRLVHHEFAGLAGLEQNRGQQSDYVVSDQLSQFLEREIVLRLPVTTKKDPKGLRTNMCGANVLLQSHQDESSDGDIPTYGSYPSQVSARDFVIALMKDKNSALSKAVHSAKILIEPGTEDEPSYGSNHIGEAVSAGGGGRVESSYADSLIPIFETGKRYEGLVAYVRVTQSDMTVFEGLPLDKDAKEYTSTRVSGVLVVAEPSKSFDLPWGVGVEFDSKSCRPINIPKVKDIYAEF
ncbi:MAG: hypothetical protein V4760_01870, partial [Bdellovibrionota bacterium]